MTDDASGPTAAPRWAWGSERSRTGGIDEIPLLHRPGRLLLCGKHHIGPDHESVIRAHTVQVVVCLTERTELADRYPAYLGWLSAAAEQADLAAHPASHNADSAPAHPCGAIWAATPDLGALAVPDMVQLVAAVDSHLQLGRTVLVHCAAGIGRTGTLAVALLMRHGLAMHEACAHVAAHRPLAGPETGPQRELLAALATLATLAPTSTDGQHPTTEP